MPDPTPGQLAYETFVRAGYPEMVADAEALWHTVQPHLRRAWEAASQAVLDQAQATATRTLPAAFYDALESFADDENAPRFRFALGQHVRRTGDAAQRWEIWYRTCREEQDRTFLDYGLRLIDPTSEYSPCRMSDGTDLMPAEETP